MSKRLCTPYTHVQKYVLVPFLRNVQIKQNNNNFDMFLIFYYYIIRYFTII